MFEVRVRPVPLVLACAALISTTAFAGKGGHSGNGGDIVYCPNGKSVFLDVKEGADRGLRLELPPGTLKEKVARTLERAKGKEALTADRIARIAAELAEDLEFLEANPDRDLGKVLRFTNEELSDVPDSKELSLPKGCEIRQLIVQVADPMLTPYDRKYVMNRYYWSLLPLDERAAVVMHEAWLRAVVQDTGSTGIDSRFARLMNEITFSGEIERMSYATYDGIRRTSLASGAVLKRGIKIGMSTDWLTMAPFIANGYYYRGRGNPQVGRGVYSIKVAGGWIDFESDVQFAVYVDPRDGTAEAPLKYRQTIGENAYLPIRNSLGMAAKIDLQPEEIKSHYFKFYERTQTIEWYKVPIRIRGRSGRSICKEFRFDVERMDIRCDSIE